MLPHWDSDQPSYLTQSLCTDTRLTSPSADPITPGARQDSRRRTNFQVTGMTRPEKDPHRQKSNPGLPLLDRLIGQVVRCPPRERKILGEMESWICNFYLSVAALKTVWADPSLRYSHVAGTLSNQPTTTTATLVVDAFTTVSTRRSATEDVVSANISLGW